MTTPNTTPPASPLLSRRQLIVSGLTSLAGLALTGPIAYAEAATTPPPKTSLKLSSWLLGLQGDMEQQLDFVERAGFEAIELRGSIAKEKQNWIKTLSKRPFTVSAMDWSHFTDMVSDDKTKRQTSIDSLKFAIDTAHEVKAPVLVCVPPRYGQNVVLPDPVTTRKILLETLTPLAELAVQAGTCIGVEAVHRSNVNCLHTLVEVAGFIRESKSAGLGLVADFAVMINEETNQTGAMLSGGKYIKQVHLSSRKRTLPGKEKEDEQQFLEGFRGLKMIGYQGFCSYEVWKDREVYQQDVIKSIAFLRDVWARA